MKRRPVSGLLRALGVWGALSCSALLLACSASPPLSSVSSAGAGSSESVGGASGADGTPAKAGQSGSAGVGSLSGVTFHKDIEPILQRSCQSCHVSGGIAPFPLLSYADARPFGAAMVEQTKSRSMPPWHAQNTDECTVPLGWKNDTRLSELELATFEAWQAGGFPEGNLADAPPSRELSPGLPGVQLELSPSTPFQLNPGADQFRCFILDPKLDKDSFVNGVFVVPGNAAVVHHVLIFADPSGKSLANADASKSYDCFGGANIGDSQLLTAWTPGGIPMEYPANIAVPLTAGTLLVMQVHYHPHSATDAASDATRLQLRFSSTRPQYNAVNALIGNFRSSLPPSDGLLPGPDDPASGPAFLIPANARAHTETMQFTLGDSAFAPRLYGIGGHMHYVGVDEKVSLTHTDGSSTCLMQIPHWDFDWQRRYDYDAPIDALPKFNQGDKLDIRCTYDNSMANPKVAASLLEQGIAAPRPVSLGEGTLDEMCLVSLTALYPAK